MERRLEEHNLGNSTYTSFTRPFSHVFNQVYSSLSKARKVEYKLKSFKSKKIIEKIIASGQITLSTE